MASRYVSEDGMWSVETVALDRLRGRGVERFYRIKRHGFVIAEVTTVEAIAEYVDLALLHPADP